MALTPHVTRELAKLVQPGARVASLGYPDIIAAPEEIEAALGDRFKRLRFRDDSEKVCKYHGLSPRQIPHADSFFELLEARLDVYDICEIRGGEILCDLNEPQDIPPVYDFVLDVGTAEHCFNIGQAIKTMAGMLNEGGTIFHSNPYNSGNHGFYGLNPTLFADFYQQHGFELLWCFLQRSRQEELIEVPQTGRFVCNAGEVNILTAARRTAIAPIVFPMQTKYVKLNGGKNGIA